MIPAGSYTDYRRLTWGGVCARRPESWALLILIATHFFFPAQEGSRLGIWPLSSFLMGLRIWSKSFDLKTASKIIPTSLVCENWISTRDCASDWGTRLGNAARGIQTAPLSVGEGKVKRKRPSPSRLVPPFEKGTTRSQTANGGRKHLFYTGECITGW